MKRKLSHDGLYALLLGLGVWLRAIDLWRPVDGSVREAWRECDMAAVARNFYQEGMNILYPRIDWRGDGPGYAEMEFPALSWQIALLYKILGLREQMGRSVPFVFSIGSMLAFFALARRFLRPQAALAAAAFFVLSPLSIRVANSLQPEAIMLFFIILTVYTFLRWLDEEKWLWYWLTGGSASCALLAKVNSAHIGLLFLGLVLVRKGRRGLRSRRLWALAALIVLPAVLWYTHAHRLWLDYGNSLGLSNEYHWIGLDFFTNPRFVLGILRIEALFVWMPLGWVVAAYGLWRRRERGAILAALWTLAVLIYYVIASRTTSEDWSIYYHVASVPPAALLFGHGLGEVVRGSQRRRSAGFVVAGALAVMVVLARLLTSFRPTILAAGLITGGGAIVALGLPRASGGPKPVLGWHGWLGRACIPFCAASSLILCGFRIAKDVHPSHMQAIYQCARVVRHHIPADDLIVASGGHSVDEDGYPLAINAPYLFYWLEHKGFNVAIENQSVAALESLAMRGARWFVAEREAVAQKPGFAQELAERFPLVAECGDLQVFRLVPADASACGEVEARLSLSHAKTEEH
ncbi:MAG: glycosyltransferase family 39 protein [candidate division KSB1 bacterium]|nr:glycosyltransferase family 39 protein [candidate division KSB1 bacterium]